MSNSKTDSETVEPNNFESLLSPAYAGTSERCQQLYLLFLEQIKNSKGFPETTALVFSKIDAADFKPDFEGLVKEMVGAGLIDIIPSIQ